MSNDMTHIIGIDSIVILMHLFFYPDMMMNTHDDM